jgi:mono/diheme cytochrome c family protein
MQSTSIRIVSFGLVVIGTFVGLGAYLFDLSGGAGFATTSGDVSAEAGEQIFSGKGKCSTCHSIGDEGSAVRCPNFGVKLPQFTEPISIRAAKRKPGQSAVEYMVESVYDPAAFVVPGFPNGVMTPINRPPIALKDDEIRSVLLFLLSKSGVDPTAEVAKEIAVAQRRFAGGATVASSHAGPTLQIPDGNVNEGRQVFQTMRCFQCHTLQGVQLEGVAPGQLGASVGPELTGIGAIQTNLYLFESILNPNAVILPDPSPDKQYSEEGASKMPSYASAMTLDQAFNLVTFLKSLQETPVSRAPLPPSDQGGTVE